MPVSNKNKKSAANGAATPNPNPFLALLDQLESTDIGSRQALLDEWTAQHTPPYPFAYGEQVSFIVWHWLAQTVSLVGDPTCWMRSTIPLTKVAGTHLWYYNYKLPTDARIDYKYIIDGQWVFDPLNSRRSKSGYGENSEFAMPDWKASDSLVYRPDAPHGQIINHNDFRSAWLGNGRDIAVYLPPDYNLTRGYPSFYVHDGLEYLSLAAMQTVLDNLIAARRIEPLVAVFVAPSDRAAEYGGRKQPEFERFMTEELVPFIDRQYGTGTIDPARRGMMGASMGGHISLRMAQDFPQLFGRVASQSGSLWAYDGQLMSKFRSRRPSGRIYLATGNICDNTGINDSFAQMLRSTGYEHQYKVYNEGHSWGYWRNDLEPMLTYLWSAR